MFELMGFLVLAAIAGVVLLGLFFILGVLKIAFKIVWIPVGLALTLLKVGLGLVAAICLLTFGIPVLAIGVVLAPLALLALFVWGGFSLLAAVF